MAYKAEIIVSEDPENIMKCLEQERIIRERSSVSLEKEGSVLKIKVEAKDAVALRATMNSITQALAVYAKAKGIK